MLDGPQGFFIMAEGGKVDWACHANDARAVISDMIDLDNAVRTALEFAQKHPDETLIVVAGDHECGGMTIGFAGTKYNNFFQVLDGQKASYVKFSKAVMGEFKKSKGGEIKFEDVKPLIEEQFGLKFEGEAKDPLFLKPLKSPRSKRLSTAPWPARTKSRRTRPPICSTAVTIP